MTPDILQALIEKTGTYRGRGRNHANEEFDAWLNIEPLLAMPTSELGVRIQFKAVDCDTIFHQEETWIARDLLSEKIGLWSISSNTPGVLAFELRSDQSDTERQRILVFGFGEPSDHRNFREEIALDFWNDGSLGYRYSWGVPHGEFAARSSVRMTRQ